MNNFIKKIVRRIVLKILFIKGYSGIGAQVSLEQIEEDLYKNKEISLLKKIRFYKKGFLFGFLNYYKIDNEEYFLKYLPILKYYKLHPINGLYSNWIDDKLTMRYMLNPFHDNLPKYYFQVMNGRIIKLLDCPEMYSADIAGFIDLLKDKGEIAAKLLFGSRQIGFTKFAYFEDSFFINDKEASEEELKKAISSMENYLMTEYIIPYKDIHKIFPTCSTPIRFMIINDEEGFRIVGSLIRFETNRTAFNDDRSGGIFCGVDIEDGTIFNPIRFDANMNIIPALVHPDTGEEIKGRVKNWSSIIDLLTKIGGYLPQLCLLGYDIIVTEDSFKIIEINSLQGLGLMEVFHQIMTNDSNRRFFNKRINDMDKR